MNKLAFFLLFSLALLFLGCSEKSNSSAELSVTPDKWVVDYYPADSVYTEFTIRNSSSSNGLSVYSINLLAPDLTAITELSPLKPLFDMQIPEVDLAGHFQIGYSASKQYVYNGLNSITKPLCPSYTTVADAEIAGAIVGDCRKGYSIDKYNNSLRIKLNYNMLDKSVYSSLKASGISDSGDFFIEICSSDTGKQSASATCPKGTSTKIQIRRTPEKPPQPLIKLSYINPVSGIKEFRVIKDQVLMSLSSSCVSDPDDADKFLPVNDPSSEQYNSIKCAADQKKYRVLYKWDLIETPTPLAPETRITLDNISSGGEGQWYEDNSNQNPKLAHFKMHMFTPTADNKFYTVRIQAKAIELETDLESEITTIVDTPTAMPASRVMVQLTWDKGLDIKAQLDRKQGTAIDLDLHLIKKKSLEADSHQVDKGADGLMCTRHILKNSGSGTTYHDDCYFNDKGTTTDSKGNEIIGTNKWGAALDLDNVWGGGNFTNPETINLGPIDDINKDGAPDFNIIDDEYLIVVNYTLCMDLADASNNKSCKSDGANYEVTARVDVMIDGAYAPREGKDTLYREFKIHPSEWIVAGKVKWDQAAQGRNYPQWTGDAVVTDNHADYKICLFPKEECFLNTIPVWDKQKYYDFVTVADTAAGYDKPRGTCY